MASTLPFEHDTYGFIGLGLIGGSIARAIRKAFPESVICAYDPDQISLRLAERDGVVNKILPGITEELTSCRVIFLCAPVSDNAAHLMELAPYLAEGGILTDVGSVKTDMHKKVDQAGLSRFFIGGHPMAGSERIGYRNSKALLLENAYYILTPSEDAPEENVSYMKELISRIGALPLVLSYEMHDFATAAISHLPHIVSAALVNTVRKSDSPDGLMKMLAAGGFKDITRISSSSPDMWEQICMTNQDNILTMLDRYIDSLNAFRALLTEKDAASMHDTFEEAREYRESFSEVSSGPIKKNYGFQVDIEDQPGVIAEVALLLANRRISIKNLGISHNREYQSGVLHVEFHTEKAEEAARFLLISKGYTVH